MTIYYEEFLLQNTIINFCLLRLVFLTTKNNTNFFRLIFASIFGAIFSVICANFLQNIILINLLKFLCAIIMLIFSCKQKLKSFIFNFILLFIYTYALGGAVIALSGSASITNAGVIIKSKINLTAICLLVIALTYVFEFVASCIKFKIKKNSLIYETTLYLNNNKIKINAFLDTGNNLTINGEPVLVLDVNSYAKLAKLNLMEVYLKSGQKIATGTVLGKQNLMLFKIDKASIKNGKATTTHIKPYVALSSSINSDAYSALLNPALL